MIAWEDDSGLDGRGVGVFAQIFDAIGSKVGSQFQVNTYSWDNQWAPSIASLNNGNFVIAWTDGVSWSNGADGSYGGIFAQIFDATGTKIGTQNFRVNTYVIGDQEHPAVVGLNNGDFVVTWQDFGGEDGSGAGVFAQIFDATGAQVGIQFQVNTHTIGNQQAQSVAAFNDSSFVVAWEDDNGLDGSGVGIFAQAFNTTGGKLGSEFQVNTYTNGNQINPSVATLSNGDFIITWEDDSGEDGNGYGMFGQMFNAGGTQVGSEFRVNSYTRLNLFTPFVSSLGQDNFVVAWQDTGVFNPYIGISAQIFNSSVILPPMTTGSVTT